MKELTKEQEKSLFKVYIMLAVLIGVMAGMSLKTLSTKPCKPAKTNTN